MTIRVLSIPGRPMGKQRPRVLKNGVPYTPKETVNYETLVKQLYIQKYGQEMPFKHPVKMKIIAYLQIPKSASKVKAAAMERGDIRPTKKPDMSNIIKIIEDGLNGLAYCDDSQVVEVEAGKYYSNCPRVEVILEEV